MPPAKGLSYDMLVDEDSTHQSTLLAWVCCVLAGVSLFFLMCCVLFLYVCHLLSVPDQSSPNKNILLWSSHYCYLGPLLLLQAIIMSTIITLNCWIVSEKAHQIFQVELEKTKTIRALKDVIKDKVEPTLVHILTNALTLWKFSIPDEDIEEKYEQYYKHLLQPMMTLSSVFPNQRRTTTSELMPS